MIPYQYITQQQDLRGALDKFVRAPLVAIDLETTGLDPHQDRILLMQMSNGQDNIVINMVKEHSLSKVDRDSTEYKMFEQICLGGATKIGHNVGFEFKMIKAHFGIEMENMYDTMIAEKILVAGKDIPSNKYQRLDQIVPKYTSLTSKDMNKSIRKDFYSGFILDEFHEEHIIYGARDTYVLLPIYWKQVQQLYQDGLGQVADLEFSIIAPVMLMEYMGVNMDIPYWTSMLEETRTEMQKVRLEIQEYLKPLQIQKSIFAEYCSISVDSPTQLVPALRKLGLEVESSESDILEKIKGDHPIVEPLLKYRELNQIMKVYGYDLLAKINQVTGRIHASFRQNNTSTQRFSSAKPNLQNIPGQQKYRRGFVAPEGYVCLSGDFSGQELRVMAYMSNEANMLDAFQHDRDLHTQTTARIYKVEYEFIKNILDSLDDKLENKQYNQVTDEERLWKANRAKAKASNFLTNYGGSYKRLSEALNIPEGEAKTIIAGLFESYPGLKTFIDNEGNRAVAQGYSTTLMGRRRYYTMPPRNDPEYQKVAGAVRRQAVNQKIQGTSASMTKKAIAYAFKEFRSKFGYENAYMWAAVHDELDCMVREDLVEEAKEILHQCMDKAFYDLIPREVCPNKVDLKHSSFWVH